VAHAASGRRGGSGDEAGDGLFAVFTDPLGGFFFGGSAKRFQSPNLPQIDAGSSFHVR
jgi:hypothetical protein